MPAPDTSVSVEVEKLVYGGEGLARVNGQVLLVPYVLPGEHVTVAPERVNAGLLRGSTVQVTEFSPHRVVPRCEYFGVCGGCQYQHSAYEFQVEQKEAILRETLERLGGFAYRGEIRKVYGHPWNYRNRIQLHFDDGRTGFHKRGSHDLCDIEHCYISSPTLVQAVQKLRDAAGAPQWPNFLNSLELFTNERELQMTVVDAARPVAARFFEWCATFLGNLAPGAIDYQAAGGEFRISRGSFFQVNRFLVDSLVDEAVADSAGKHAIDLYAGVGLFSVPLAARFQRVDAVERAGLAHRDLVWNAGANPNLQPIRASAEDFLRELADPPDLAIADPPRAGIGRQAAHELLRLRPARLTLVSCDPSTLSRDLKNLLTAYDIDRLTIIDLFPQTYHFETIAHLKCK